MSAMPDARPRPIFILGAPRTGTTLLQRVLNSYDDVLLWGEHAGFLADVARAFYAAWDHPSLFRDVRPLAEVLRGSQPRESWQAWMSWTSREDWLQSFRAFLDLLFVPGGLPGKAYWGFKEIRYMTAPGERTLDFLHALYPDAIYLFIVRNAFNALASVKRIPEGAHHLRALKATCARWRNRYEAYHAWHRSGRIRSYWIVYEELIEGRGELLALLDALGRSLGDEQRAVMRSAEGRWSSFKDEAFNERWRRLPPAWLALTSAMLGDLNAAFGYANPPQPALQRLRGRLLLRGLALRERWTSPTPGAAGAEAGEDGAARPAAEPPAAPAQTRS